MLNFILHLCYNNNHIDLKLTLSHMILTFNYLMKEAFKNIVRKGDNAGDQYFLLFQQCFLPYQIHKSPFQQHLILVCKCFQFCSVNKLCHVVKG